MMKAIEINGVVKLYVNGIPSTFNGVWGYNSPNNAAQQDADGWKDFVEPPLESYETKGNIILDEVNDVYTYEVVTIPLADLKEVRVNEIDRRTKEVIYGGFTFDSELFSMSTSAQINLSNIFNIPDELFPLTYSTKNNGVYSLELVDRQNFYLAALNHKNSSIQSGTALKQQILACTTVSEVNAIIDNR